MNAWTTVAGFSVKTHARLAELSRRNSLSTRLLLLTLCTDITSSHRHLCRHTAVLEKKQKTTQPASL